MECSEKCLENSLHEAGKGDLEETISLASQCQESRRITGLSAKLQHNPFWLLQTRLQLVSLSQDFDPRFLCCFKC